VEHLQANNQNVKAGGQLNTNTVAAGTISDSIFCGRYLNEDGAGANFDGTVCSRVTPFTLGVRFDNREATGGTTLANGPAIAAVAAAGGEATKQEASSQTAAGAPTEPLGTIGFSLGFAQIAC